MKKIVAVVLALCAVLCFCASCASNTEKTELKVKVTFRNQGKDMYESQEVTLEKTEDFIPTILDAALKVLDDNEIPYKTGELGGYTIFNEIDGVKETSDKFWQTLLNGDVPDVRMAACAIADGDDIVIFYDVDPDAETTVVETTAKVYETAADDFQ